VNDAFKGFWGFWRGVFSESDGTPSLSRIATGVLIGFACGWVTSIVKHTFTLPDFAGLALLISSVYGINKISAAFKKEQP
jgi:hypothetical protein